MDLDQQLQILIQQAPQDGVTPLVMQQAVNPILKLFAQQLQHQEYYVMQTLEQSWVLTTLSNRTKANLSKKVIYAFTTAQDAQNFHNNQDGKLIAIKLPVTHILFQLFTIDKIDSLVFMEKPGDLNQGTEVHRAELHKLIQEQLEQLKPNNTRIPYDIA